MRGSRALLAAAIVAVVLLGLDLAARAVAEGRLEGRARAEAPGVQSVRARIGSFPFLPRLLVSGSVPAVDVRLDQVPTRFVQLTAVEVGLRGVEVDRDVLLQGETRLNHIDRGTASLELDSGSLSRALRVPVAIAGGQVRARAGPAQVSARPEVGRDGTLVLRVGGQNLRLPLARTRLLPCAATRAAVVGDRVRLSCDLDEVPPGLHKP